MRCSRSKAYRTRTATCSTSLRCGWSMDAGSTRPRASPACCGTRPRVPNSDRKHLSSRRIYDGPPVPKKGEDMSSTQQQARYAGFLYLILALIAPIGLLYVPGKLIVSGNATATADHIRASELLLRIGIASELFHQVIGVLLVLALYRLFKAVNETHAKLVVILGALVSLPIVFVNVLNEIAALILVSGADFLSVFAKPQLDALAYLFVRLHNQGIIVASIFC